MRNPIDCLNDALSNRYRIERELGEGGRATVYLTGDPKHDRRVAIKIFRPELAHVERRLRGSVAASIASSSTRGIVCFLHQGGQGERRGASTDCRGVSVQG